MPSDFLKRISNYGCYGYKRFKRTSVATIAPHLVDSKLGMFDSSKGIDSWFESKPNRRESIHVKTGTK